MTLLINYICLLPLVHASWRRKMRRLCEIFVRFASGQCPWSKGSDPKCSVYNILHPGASSKCVSYPQDFDNLNPRLLFCCYLCLQGCIIARNQSRFLEYTLFRKLLQIGEATMPIGHDTQAFVGTSQWECVT